MNIIEAARAAAIILALALLAGCDVDDNPTPVVKSNFEHVPLYWGGAAVVFHLRDGTRCITTIEGSIDCDWRQPSGLAHADPITYTPDARLEPNCQYLMDEETGVVKNAQCYTVDPSKNVIVPGRLVDDCLYAEGCEP